VVYLYDGVDPVTLQSVGEVHTPSVADLFIAQVTGGAA